LELANELADDPLKPALNGPNPTPLENELAEAPALLLDPPNPEEEIKYFQLKLYSDVQR
jgi:hypothetical protein